MIAAKVCETLLHPRVDDAVVTIVGVDGHHSWGRLLLFPFGSFHGSQEGDFEVRSNSGPLGPVSKV